MIDLKRHAQRYRMNGLPIYGRWEDGEEDMQVGVIVEPLWQWADLGEADRATVQSHTAAMLVDPRAADLTEDALFYFACADFAIACPHLHWTYHEPTHRECKGCRVVEHPLPGRVVMVGDKRRRVTDPPPRRLRIPRPVTQVYVSNEPASPHAPAMEIDEYEWDGQRYHQLNGVPPAGIEPATEAL